MMIEGEVVLMEEPGYLYHETHLRLQEDKANLVRCREGYFKICSLSQEFDNSLILSFLS